MTSWTNQRIMNMHTCIFISSWILIFMPWFPAHDWFSMSCEYSYMDYGNFTMARLRTEQNHVISWIFALRRLTETPLINRVSVDWQRAFSVKQQSIRWSKEHPLIAGGTSTVYCKSIKVLKGVFWSKQYKYFRNQTMWQTYKYACTAKTRVMHKMMETVRLDIPYTVVPPNNGHPYIQG